MTVGVWLALLAMLDPERVVNALNGDGQVSPTLVKTLQVVGALAIGIGGTTAFFVASNRALDQFHHETERKVRPWLFLLPAVSLLAFFLVFPSVLTLWLSIVERPSGTGLLENYRTIFTEPDTLATFRNTAIWLVLVPIGSVSIGLTFATLVDRIRREAFAKTFIFLPVAISMVGASVIFRFVYIWRPPGQPQIGAANAALSAGGFEPVAFFQTPVINTLVLIGILVWMETGFAMIVFSAAIKSVPDELIGAARMDGASEFEVFRHVVLPHLKAVIITVATTVFIVALKIFDIVFVTTGGRFDSDVVANRMITELVKFRNPGRAAALAVVLMLATIPVIVANTRNLGGGPSR
jgi:alpha-glucoside transport system permease protein